MAKWQTMRGRDSERELLSDLVSAVQAGRSQVLVLRGEPGIGKTTLLEHLIEHVEGCRLAQSVGVEAEMELAFTNLHQLCYPFRDRFDRLPAPQRDALGTAFGLQRGSPPDRFVVGLAVLTLLSEAAAEQPVVCVVDDAQWLDQASAQALEFVARRLDAESVGLVLAMREGGGPPMFTGLPELVVGGLARGEAAALLDSTMTGRLDPRVRDRLVAESRGNPLALIELPRELTTADLAFGPSGEPSSEPPLEPRAGASLMHRLRLGFLRQIETLPPQTRQLLLLAAAEPVGDVRLLRSAAERLGVDVDRAIAADSDGLLEVTHRVEFRHPMIRSVVYRSASAQDQREVHGVLAEVTDPSEDPDRRAWHRARAAPGPDETVAAELEASADRALGRGGIVAAAAFLEAAATRTPDPARRAQRSLAAAQARMTAGAFDEALTLLAAANAGPLGEVEQARVQLLQAQIAHHSEHGNKALPLLLSAARRLEPVDPKLARETYLDALAAAMFAGRLAPGFGIGMRQVAEAMREVRLPSEAGKSDQLLRDIAVLYTDGYAVAAPSLRRTVQAFGREELTMDEAVRFAWLAACVAVDVWDDTNWDILTRRHLDVIRAIGALGVLPVALNSRVIYLLYSGDLEEAASLVAESSWIAEVTGGQNAMIPYGEASLHAMRGDIGAAESLFRPMLDDITSRGEGVGLNMVSWFQAIMYNGAGRHEDALAAARVAAGSPLELGPPKFGLAELVEAGVRSGHVNEAHLALEELSVFAQASGTELALAVEAGRKALLSAGTAAEECYREEIERLERTTLRFEHARAQLRYGEWLRREGRRIDARMQFRASYQSLSMMGAAGFAERARHELAATGETVRQQSPETAHELTAQEAHIARLAADGLSNAEIGAVLFISPRTVEWHLRKVFVKLGVTTRRQLRLSMPQSVRSSIP